MNPESIINNWINYAQTLGFTKGKAIDLICKQPDPKLQASLAWYKRMVTLELATQFLRE